ncbi:MAG: VanW family protein [Candidatus Blackburnbacteria bacterium]|nr:VanW family protein [Candidatus Blackburnbacteria bacterium]
MKTLFWTFLFLAILTAVYTIYFFNKIFPGVQLAGINLSGKTKEQALKLLLPENKPPGLTLVADDPKIQMSLDVEVNYNYEQSVEAAYAVGRTGSFEDRLLAKVSSLVQKPNLPYAYSLRQEALDKSLADIADQIGVPPTEPTLIIEKNAIIVNKGKDGIEVDQVKLREQVLESLKYKNSNSISIPLKKTKAQLSDTEAEEIKVRAQNIVGKSLQLSVDYKDFTYKAADILPLLTPNGVKEEKLASLINNIASSVDTEPQNARLVFEDGKVKEFAPGKDGLETNKVELGNRLKAGVENLIVSEAKATKVEIPVNRKEPQVGTSEVNNLGIKELIGRGTSLFAGSIPGRVHNVTLAASRLNGLLIKPGETFSFNNALGDVSAYTGYQQAYVIKDGKTVLGDGGGVCQVSTTLFRAALNAGLPITERHPHAYRVHYYEEDTKPGIDATVYSPGTDLRIQNDTPANILIQTSTDTKKMALVFELYGTSDGRVSQILNHRIWDVVSAPPPLYQDDPTLAPGVIKQVDFAAPGTKAAFDYKVTRNGEVLQNRTFYSNYRSWQAIYLRGVTP